MKDQNESELAGIFAESQRDFDALAREYNAACEAFEAAERARTLAASRLTSGFNELQGLLRAMHEQGPLPPLRMAEAGTYLAMAKLRDEQELHADMPDHCPDPSAN